MNGRASRLIRKFCRWAGFRHTPRDQKRAWKAKSHRERGKARRKIERVMQAPAIGIGRNRIDNLNVLG